ncbi:MAG: hypothetical protein ACLQOO_19160 [Terriglobia bacterium]
MGAYLGSYLKKKGENLATHEDIDKLVKQVSAVTAATRQIEAKITRASRVYERQLDILQKLYRPLYIAQELFKRMTSTGRLGTLTPEGNQANEITPQEYAPKVDEAMRAAFDEFLNGRLFIPPALVQQCEAFFNAYGTGSGYFTWAHLPTLDPTTRAEFWTKAATVAHQEVPKILQQIDDAARALIQGEANTTPT